MLDKRAVIYNPNSLQLRIQRAPKGQRDEYLHASLPQNKKRRDSWDLFIQRDGTALHIKDRSEKPGNDIFIGRLDLEDLGVLNNLRRRSGKLAEIYVSKPNLA